MQNITIPELVEIVEHIAIGQNQPIALHGPAGCGKSQGINQACTKLDAQLIDFRVGQYDTVDFKGYPEVDREDNVMVWRPASTLPVVGNPRFDPKKLKIVFFDEWDHGKDSVKGVLYQVFEERRIGEFPLMPNTYLIAAGNRPQDRGVGGKNPPPLNNRCIHYGVSPDADAWISWAMEQDHINAELIGFMSFKKDMISTFDPKSIEPAFATPRTWEKVGRIETTPTIPERVREASIAGAVGHGPSIEYQAFKAVIKDMVSIADIVKNPTGVELSHKPEVQWATSIGIGSEMARRTESAAALHKYLKRMPQDFLVLSWQLALRKNEQLLGTPEFLDVAKTHQQTFAAINRG